MSDNSLRGQTIEAMAEAAHKRWHRDGLGPCDMCRVEASVALDAALVFLTDNAEVWQAAAWDQVGHPDNGSFGAAAIAALRDTRETP